MPSDTQVQPSDEGKPDDTHGMSDVGVVGIEEPIIPTPPAEDLVLPAAPSELQLQPSDEGELDDTHGISEVGVVGVEEPTVSTLSVEEPVPSPVPSETHGVSEVGVVGVEEPFIPTLLAEDLVLLTALSESQLQPSDEGKPDDTHGTSEVGVVSIEEPIIPTSPAEDLVLPAAPSELQLQLSDEGELDDTTSMFEAETVGVEEPITPTPPAQEFVLPPVPSETQLQPSDKGELDDTHGMSKVGIVGVEEPTVSTLSVKEPVPSETQPQPSDESEDALDDTHDRLQLETTGGFDDVPAIGYKEKTRRTPRQYRPPVRTPGPLRRGFRSPQIGRSFERPLPIEVRLLFERGGFVRVSLLARRQPGLSEDVVVSGSGAPLELTALQDNYYQDVMLPEIGKLLRQGVEWEGCSEDRCRVCWSLSGRELYILSAHNDLSGFVSTPRLVLGKEHVILCTLARLLAVKDVIEKTGSPAPVLLDSEGIPAGWVGLQGVLPHRPAPQSTEQDILNILRPLPDVEIILEGGIRFERTTWLIGYPPRICLYGDPGAIGEVMIDGKRACRGPDGAYIVEGWDLVGSHTVWCTSLSRTYSIKDSTDEWGTWDAYSWAVYDRAMCCRRSLPTICGAFVSPKSPADEELQTIVLPTANPVAIGERPGEIAGGKVRTDIHPDFCTGFVPFEPIWALPADSYHSDKKVARVVLVGDRRAVQGPKYFSQVNREQIESIRVWCSAVLAAGRKGLRTEPDTSEVNALWRTYKRRAKSLWKRLR